MAARSGCVVTLLTAVDLFAVSGRCMSFLNSCPRKSLLMHAVKGDSVEMVSFLVTALKSDLHDPCSWNPSFKVRGVIRGVVWVRRKPAQVLYFLP